MRSHSLLSPLFVKTIDTHSHCYFPHFYVTQSFVACLQCWWGETSASSLTAYVWLSQGYLYRRSLIPILTENYASYKNPLHSVQCVLTEKRGTKTRIISQHYSNSVKNILHCVCDRFKVFDTCYMWRQWWEMSLLFTTDRTEHGCSLCYVTCLLLIQSHEADQCQGPYWIWNRLWASFLIIKSATVTWAEPLIGQASDPDIT